MYRYEQQAQGCGITVLPATLTSPALKATMPALDVVSFFDTASIVMVSASIVKADFFTGVRSLNATIAQ